jgi:hypothetical protein
MLATVAACSCSECMSKVTDAGGRCRQCRPGRRRPAPPPPPFPTEHLPGSEEKIIVMMLRIQQGYHLRHVDDATEDRRPNGPSRFCHSNAVREPRTARVLMRSA